MPEEPKEFSRTAEDLIASLRRLPSDSPPGMRKRATRDLAALMEGILTKYQIGRDSPEQTIRDHWVEIVGPANAQYSHPARIERDKMLIVLVSHSVVRNELFLHRKLIVEKIQKYPGCAQVREINVRQG